MCHAGSAGPRPEKRARTETEGSAPNKRASHLPYARAGYNSEEWVFDDEDEDDDLPADQRHELRDEEDRMADENGDLGEAGIRSLEVGSHFMV